MIPTPFITFMGTPARGRCWICRTKGSHKWFDVEVGGLICQKCIESAALVDTALAQMRSKLRLSRCNPKPKRHR